jgi:hypothetical protein
MPMGRLRQPERRRAQQANNLLCQQASSRSSLTSCWHSPAGWRRDQGAAGAAAGRRSRQPDHRRHLPLSGSTRAAQPHPQPARHVPWPAHPACTSEYVRDEGQIYTAARRSPRAGLLLAGCGRTGDFTIHDAEDGVSLLAGWVVEQRQQRAANSGDGKQKLVR